MMIRTRRWFVAALTGVGLAIGAGCTKPELSPASTPAKVEVGEHAHKPGAHGGIVVDIGRQDSYHAEAVFEKSGKFRLYILGQDETTVSEIETQTLSAYVKAEGGDTPEPFELKPEPQPGDAKSMTSQFVGQLPKDLVGKRVEVTIMNLRIGKDRFRVPIRNSAEEHGRMPAKVDDEAERTLYLTAGGKYTEADIKANGNVTASQKFKGLKAEHDLKPKAGDQICPITLTKANPKFSWVVGGKTYEFCCPPCVDEFVAAAKETPDEIKEPEQYRKK